MTTSRKAALIAGWVLHVLIGGMLIFAGCSKLFAPPPPEFAEKLASYGLTGHLKLIGAGELITALLLLIPRTLSLGVLLVSGFWGGVICIHMTHGESYVLPSVLLVVSWLGAALRFPHVG